MSARGPITTHVLDVSLGRPAAGIAVSLAIWDERENAYRELGAAETDSDGRAPQLLAPGTPISPGRYRISFAVAPYLERTAGRGFYPHVDITFLVSSTAEHYHVPLLLSPFGYSTYRGS